MMKCFVLLIFVCVLSCVWSEGLNEEFTWTRINYVWPTQSRGGFYQNSDFLFPGENPQTIEGDELPSNLDYQYENNIPMGANVWKNKLFITVPRRRLGVPSTLNYVDLNGRNRRNVPLTPYPDWKTNLFPSQNYNSTFFSVYRVAVDACDRLWFVDTGLLESPGNNSRIKPVTLYVMDLNNDQIIHSHQFPSSSISAASNFASITVDVTKNNCQNAYAYMPDLAGYGLTVYSLRNDRSWRVTHNYFYLEPHAGEFTIAGHTFQWNDGVFSVELSEIKSDGNRDMYFHSMAGHHMYRVNTRFLKNETLATRSYHGRDFEDLGNRGENSQTSSADIHQESGVMFLGLVNQNALACWNTASSLRDISIVAKNDRTMIYPCDVKVYKDKVYMLTNTMPEFLYGQLNYGEINFRIWSNTIRDAVRNTACEGRSRRY
ncbi:unnamed protein product [Brassicogethes aeneus]|uniref:Uncharacterized protein n=1 Tax=Brassicogethes aeneus TaxID=1431903 RepID=A0A9P0BK80_BRAAE|nr:unnamed protein product [Brassicogethes aeneus]